MKKAVIDLGSNTIRLSIYEISGGSFSRIFTQKVTRGWRDTSGRACSLGKGYAPR